MQLRKWKLIQPFALIVTGSLLTILGSLVTQCSESRRETFTQKAEHQRMEFTLAQDKHKRAFDFLDQYSTVTTNCTYAASDYFYTLRTSKDKAVIDSKKEQYELASKDFTLLTPMIITMGHNYFGAEFKDTFHKVFLIKIGELHQKLIEFEENKTEEIGIEVLKLQDEVDLLHGYLLGIAAKKLHNSKYRLND